MKKLGISAVALFLILGGYCQKATANDNKLEVEECLYQFVESLLNPTTGLVASREGECFTTVYKNSLAAMALIHEANLTPAERIFDVFQEYHNMQGDSFHGFPQVWDPCTGLPDTNSDYWEGDNAFLLLALNYYNYVSGNYEKYQDLSQGLLLWLSQRADSCEIIVAEGVANMYAALAPFAGDSAVQQRLTKLQYCFDTSVNYESVLDHTVRGSLVFCDISGFEYLDNFTRTETWEYDDSTEVKAYSPFNYDGEEVINVEISAQLLLAWKNWKSNLPVDLSDLQGELEKLLLPGKSDPQSLGLPYTVTDGDFPDAFSLPIIDPTCYLLFYYWRFNPFAPCKKCAQVTAVEEEISETPQSFYLFQNYPNPFNSQTTINYHLTEHSKVYLAIYNIKGQKVKTLINNSAKSGSYDVTWRGKDDRGAPVSSGIYFYKLQAGNHIQTKKMLLLK